MRSQLGHDPGAAEGFLSVDTRPGTIGARSAQDFQIRHRLAPSVMRPDTEATSHIDPGHSPQGTPTAMLLTRLFAALLAFAVMASATTARSADATPNDTARYLAGLPVPESSPLYPLTKERE